MADSAGAAEDGDHDSITEATDADMAGVDAGSGFTSKKELLRKYRNLREEVAARQQEYIHDASTEGMMNTLETVEDMFKEVTTPWEALHDARLLDSLADITKQKAKALNTDLVEFIPREFAFKLVSFVGGETGPENKILPDGWSMLGRAVLPFFDRAPTFKFLSGTFERGEVQLRRVQRQRREKDTNTDKVVQPKQLNSFDEKNEATTQEVERVYEILQKHFKEHDQICFFEFVVNPHSFGLTVENMFHVSFLVRDGFVTVQLDDEELPVICPRKKTKDGKGKEGGKENISQNIFTMNPRQWREIVKVFEIQEPLIPPRSESVAARSGTSSSSQREPRPSTSSGHRRH